MLADISRGVTEFEIGLPACLGPRGRCHIDLNLGNGSRTTSRLLDCDPTKYRGRGPCGSITWNPWWLVSSVLPFYGHCMLGHHLVALTDLRFQRINWLDCCWLGYLNRGFTLSNGFVDSAVLGCEISWGIPYRCKRVYSSILGAKVPGFTNG